MNAETERADATERLDRAVAELHARGIGSVHVLAWRDLDDPEAGGSEVHADEVMRRWADRGLDVLHRTSSAVGLPAEATRHGYRVVRRGSRYSVFGRTVGSELAGRMGTYDALVEIWNGVPWFSPVWCRRPHLTVLHHIHGPMWNQIMPAPLGHVGRFIEAELAPPFYRRGLTLTGAESSRDELIAAGFRPDRIVAVPHGVDERFSPGGARTEHPSIVAVGRLAPVKRFELLIEAAAAARERVPALTLTIIGRGPLEAEMRGRIETLGATGWVTLAGRVDDTELVDAYRRSWVVASASLAEGWGLSLTEGAACGTPAVATDISGHRGSVIDGVSGVLTSPERLGATLAEVLSAPDRLDRLRTGALDWARTLTWDASAAGMTDALLEEVRRFQESNG